MDLSWHWRLALATGAGDWRWRLALATLIRHERHNKRGGERERASERLRGNREQEHTSTPMHHGGREREREKEREKERERERYRKRERQRERETKREKGPKNRRK